MRHNKYLHIKSITFTIILIFSMAAVFSGCESSSGNDELTRLTEMVRDTQEHIVPELDALCEWQVTNVDDMLKKKEEYEARGEIYQAPEYKEEIAAYKTMCENHLEETRDMADEAAKLKTLPSATYDAGKEYFLRIEESIQSLYDIMIFDAAVDEAIKPVVEFENRKFVDEASKINALYEAINEVVSNLEKVSCPSFMEQIFGRFTDTCRLYITFIERIVNSYSLGDNLRYTAASNMYTRATLYEDRYTIALTKDFAMQYEKTGERLNGSIKTLADEIIEAEKLNTAELSDYTYSYLDDSGKVIIECESVKKIYPSMYGSTDSIINFTASCDSGNIDILVETEIPGFTQKFSQTFTVTPQLTKFYIKPPLLTGELNLASAKDAQITFSVTAAKGGDVYEKKSIPVKIMSKYDIEFWNDDFGMVTKDNFLCFLTPEATAIVELKRDAIDSINKISDGQLNSFPGYQNALGAESGYEYMNTYYQIIGIQMALSENGVRYNMSPFSASGTEYLQRVLMPADVIATNSGLCVETSLVMASAIQSAGMHAMLVFPTGHAQVAVETWQDSGQYFLIETTMLPFDPYTEGELDKFAVYKTPEEWVDYISNGTDGYGCYILDCDNAKLLGLSAMSN